MAGVTLIKSISFFAIIFVVFANSGLVESAADLPVDSRLAMTTAGDGKGLAIETKGLAKDALCRVVLVTPTTRYFQCKDCGRYCNYYKPNASGGYCDYPKSTGGYYTCYCRVPC